MCRFHSIRASVPYFANSITYLERQTIDAAWSAARASTPVLGWSVMANKQNMCSQTFYSGAADAAGLASYEAEQRAARLALAEGCTEFKLAVVVHDGAYWPSREFVELLAAHAALDTDVLFVNHRDGSVTRWSIKLLLACERTICHTPLAPSATGTQPELLEHDCHDF